MVRGRRPWCRTALLDQVQPSLYTLRGGYYSKNRGGAGHVTLASGHGASALSNQVQTFPHILHGVYYFKDRGGVDHRYGTWVAAVVPYLHAASSCESAPACVSHTRPLSASATTTKACEAEALAFEHSSRPLRAVVVAVDVGVVVVVCVVVAVVVPEVVGVLVGVVVVVGVVVAVVVVVGVVVAVVLVVSVVVGLVVGVVRWHCPK